MKPSAFLAGVFLFSCLMRSTLSSNNIEPPTATNSAGHRVDSGKTRVNSNQMMVSRRLGRLRPGSFVPKRVRGAIEETPAPDGESRWCFLYVVAGGVRLRTRQQRVLDSASEGALGERIKRLFDHFEKLETAQY
jgi:hypothetical protein